MDQEKHSDNMVSHNRRVRYINSGVVAILIFWSGYVNAQDKVAHLPLDGNESIINSIHLGKNGFILKTGNASTGRAKGLVYYNAEGALVWTKRIENQYRNGESFTVSAPGGSVVYDIEIKDFTRKPHTILQIKKSGEEKKMTIEGVKDLGSSLQSVFCDDQYLYYLATQNGDERNDKKKSQEKLILNRFSHSDLSYQRFMLDLPVISGGENSIFWYFIGQDGDNKYLVSKEIDSENGKNLFNIAVFNEDGNISKKMSLQVVLDGKYTRPAWNVAVPIRGYEIASNLDFESSTFTTRVPNAPGSPGAAAGQAYTSYSTSRQNHTKGAFGYVYFDPESKAFYAYGLLGPRPFKRIGPVYEGFYLYKFDLNGNQSWKLQHDPKGLIDENFFRVHGTPSDRDINFKTLPGGKMNFSIHFKTTIFIYDIDPNGKVLASRRKDDFPGLADNAFISSGQSKSEAYIKKNYSNKKHDTFFPSLITGTGEILLVPATQGSGIDIVYFKE